MRGKLSLLTTAVFASCVAVAMTILDSKLSMAMSCSTNVETRILFVRGSGENLSGDTYNKLKNALASNLTQSSYTIDELSLNILENPTVAEDYKAVAVFGGRDSIVGLTAVITASSLGTYHDSVRTGKLVLHQYLDNLESECVVLVGYSQGAQVIGEVLSEVAQLDPGTLEKIKYVGLLGDPKFDSYGYSILPGQNVPWYRGTAIVGAQGGMLGRRWPNYIPRDHNDTAKMFTNASSWCYITDPVCSSNMAAFSLGEHGKYGIDAIPQMALEVASVINNPSGMITKDLHPKETCGAAKQDIVVLLDTSPLMRREASLFTDSPMYYGGNRGQSQPTAGEMLTRVGCGDTRIAVVGYGRAQDGPPQLLLDFTKDPKAYDALMKSLYQPNISGTYERTQFREGALTALDVGWRADAGKAIFAITDIAGSGPVGPSGWRGWTDQGVSDVYLKDSLSQQLITKAREKDAIMIGMPITHPYTGFMSVSNDNARATAQDYLRMMTSITGGYMWVKQVPNYWEHNFKYTLLDTTLNYALQLREKTVASVASVRGKVGAPVTLKVSDTLSYLAAATLRSDSKDFRWYVDCGNKAQILYDSRQEITFTPTKAQKCKATVLVSARQGTGAGCYFTCPEPFPPYFYRSFPFDIDIKLADYVPKIPAKIAEIEKTINNDKVTYTWQRPSYAGDGDIVYVVRDTDGSVLAATTSRQLTITETGGTDPEVTIEASGEDGKSELVDGSVATTTDLRTPLPVLRLPVDKPVSNGDKTGTADTEPPAVVVENMPRTVAVTTSTSELPDQAGITSSRITTPVENESAAAVLGAGAFTVTPSKQHAQVPTARVDKQGSDKSMAWWGLLSFAPILLVTIFVIRKLETKI